MKGFCETSLNCSSCTPLCCSGCKLWKVEEVEESFHSGSSSSSSSNKSSKASKIRSGGKIEVTYEELKASFSAFGLSLREEKFINCTYCQDPHSFKQRAYDCVFFSCVKSS
mmetsp:Transcript_40605/g.79672  ORF Transcript_40605/g.79672 Transcript_40605/m.79672 type:complete len:111 (+) Transcript_40605:157-489(+)